MAQVNTAENDFMESGLRHGPNRCDDIIGRQAAAGSSGKGHDTIGAGRIATVLYFQDRTGSAAGYCLRCGFAQL